MQLKYFGKSDSPDELKKKRKELAKKHHPDKHTSDHDKAKASKIMAEINAEFDYISNQTIPKVKTQESKQQFNPKAEYLNKEAIEQARDIFHALTNGTGVDVKLLIETIGKIKKWNLVFEAYQRQYGITTLMHIQKQVKDPKQKQKIVDAIINSGVAGTFISGVLAKFFKL